MLDVKKTLFLSDLDGTLLTPDACLSDFTAKTVESLVARGMHFSYATARSLQTARKVTAGLSAALPVILYNGAATADSADGRVLDARYFTAEEVAFLRRVLRENGLSPLVYTRAADSVYSERVAYTQQRISRGLADYLDTRRGDERLKEVSPEAHYAGRVFYCTVIEDDAAACEKAFEAVRADGRFTTLIQPDVYSDCVFFETMPKAATKAAAAKRLAEQLGCTQIVCFGDGANDRSMFEIADACYAVENASPALKSCATQVIGANSADGVAKKLLELWENNG